MRHDVTEEALDFEPFKSPFYYNHEHHFKKGETAVIGYFGDMMSPYERLATRKPSVSYCAMCKIPNSLENTTVVNLRGVCKFSKFDLKYKVSITSNGDLIYYGHVRSVITYNYTQDAWKILDVKDPKMSATFQSGFSTLAMGTNKWKVQNDKKCQHNKVSLYLSLTTCTDTQFTCGNGLCIGLEQRCDGVADCYDKLDEIDCKVAEIDSSYNKMLAPPPEEGKNKIPVEVAITINTFNSFDLIDSSFELEFVLALKWYDNRLTFNNLREQKSSNLMGPDETNLVWFPTIVLENTKQKVEFRIDAKSIISVERNGTGTLADFTSTENKKLFKGNENPLHYKRIDNIKLNCFYQLSWYPFDTQNCFILIGQPEILHGYVEHVPGKFLYVGPEDLTQYFVKTTGMRRVLIDGRQYIQVRVAIGRRLLTIILTTILPTVILNLIGHTANYFKEFFFEVSMNFVSYYI